METLLELPIGWDWQSSDAHSKKAQFLDAIIQITQDSSISVLMTATAMPKDIFVSAVAKLVRAYGYVVDVNQSVFRVLRNNGIMQHQERKPPHQIDRWEHFIDDLDLDIDDYDG